jgi:hypothetical protein
MAQAHLAALYNKDGFELINNYTYGESPHSIVFGEFPNLDYSLHW